MDNTVTVVGNVTREPELRFTNAGQAIASFGVAVNRRYQKNGQWVENTSFFDVTAWGTLGENIASSIPKGARVVVSGRIDQRSWETDQGEKRSKVEIVAECVGPDLRWATCEIVRNERKTSDQFGGGGSPAPAAASQPSGGYGGGGFGDEEPF